MSTDPGGHGHSHLADPDELKRVRVSHPARAVLLVSLALVALGTVVGLVRLWPDSAAVDGIGADVQFAAPGVTFPEAEVTDVQPACPVVLDEIPDPDEDCGQMSARVTTGETQGDMAQVQLAGPMAEAGLRTGDTVQLMRVPGQAGGPDLYSLFGVDRDRSLGLLAVVFIIVVGLVARLRGLLAVVGLVFSGFVLVRFLLPALLTGEPAVAVALVGSTAIMFVVLYLAHGPSTRTSAALAGTLLGIGLTALLAQYAVGASRLSGMGDETGTVLSSLVGQLDFRGLLTSAIIIAGLGVLNDVTITQTSAVWELRAAGPELSRTDLYRSGMRIGRDHIASTIYTIVFAYAGAALSVLLILFLFDRPVLELLGTEDIATEAVRTLCTAIGLVLAVPITTAIAALTVTGPTTGEADRSPAVPTGAV